MADKRPGVDVNGGHGFGLIDDQIAAGLQLHLTLKRALDFVFDVKEIENRLTPGVVLQQARHFRDVFGGKLQQRFVGQAGVHANTVELRIGEITQYALGKRQLTVKLIAGLVAFLRSITLVQTRLR